MARKGRGRLSGIEQLPEACAPAVLWAQAELQKRERTQTEIYADFIAKLQEIEREWRGELDIKIPSFSAFNRFSVSLAIMTERINRTKDIASALAENFDAESSDDITLIAAEAIKTLIFELLTSKGEAGFDPKGAKALADALRSATLAQGISTQRRAKVEADFEAKAKQAVTAVAKQRGMTAETAQHILSEILGVQK
jgi:hypothetical protein